MKKKIIFNIIRLIIWIIWLYIAISLMNEMIEHHWFNWLFLIIMPPLWWLIVWPILIINWIFNIFFDILYLKFWENNKRIWIFRVVLKYILLLIIPLIFFIQDFIYFLNDNKFNNFTYIVLIFILYLWYKFKKELSDLNKIK